ncbi:hypothetical protein ONS95_000553 [Cadophora gregata]|uniref:uncharacterized protein n=1 Tax=Cadophora gregata TaxID=51156 RepID=UPI0026DAE122|nr:uncharacterized protein ONS95_000553 [Cadophora gregata]KAK0125433.1 hypothetical protein ONS96_009274 [Cadophora gregata f. sp. sojae]KAK0128589.1 hypothetical protein ONS95_000553 [Cadophora gregata]
MSSMLSDFQQQDIPNIAYDKLRDLNDPFISVPVIGDTTHSLTIGTDAPSHNSDQTNCPPYSPAVANTVAVYPSSYLNMAEDSIFSHGSSFGPPNHIPPTKRVFSSPYIGSNTLVTSELDHTPSPKRRAGLRRPNNGILRQEIGQDQIENAGPLRHAIATQRPRRPTTSTVARSPNYTNSTSNLASPDEPQDYRKYYQFLAEKNNIKAYQMRNGEGVQSQVCVSPYRAANSATGSNQQQVTHKTSAPNGIPQSAAKSLPLDDQPARCAQPDQPISLPQQSTSLSMRPLYNGIEEKARRRTEAIRDLQRAKLEIMKQRRANTSTILGQGRVRSLTVTNSTPKMCRPHQPTQENVYPDYTQNASVLQNLCGRNSNMENGRQIGEGLGRSSLNLAPLGFSADYNGYTRACDKSLVPQINTDSFVGMSKFLAPGQPLDINPGSGLFELGPSVQYSIDETQEDGFSFTRPSTASNTTTKTTTQARPRTDINKILPAFRQDYQSYEENLMNGIQTPTNLPPWLVVRAKKKAGLMPSALPDSDSESEDDCCVELSPKLPAYQRIVATADTGPLPNINQPYTGTLNPSSPYLAAHLAVNKTAKTRTPVQTQDKKAPTSKKKRPTPRKSRARKPIQSDGQAVTPAAINLKAPTYDFSSPMNGNRINSSTLENMMAGNFTQFFGSAEEEAKWKQDAVAEAMAERDAPSKRQLKMAERERKQLEKNAKAKQ